MLKRLLYVHVMVALSAFCTACGGDDDDNGNAGAPQQGGVVITVTPEAINVDHQAQTAKINVSSTGDWSVSCDQSWVRTTPTGGLKNAPAEVNISISAHNDMLDRTATLTVRSGATRKNITITQSAPQKINITKKDYTLSSKAQTLPITVEANTTWTAAPDAQWLSITNPNGSGNGVCNVNVSANETESDRNASVVFTLPNGTTETVNVKQYTNKINVPDGYTLVWGDEFDGDALDLAHWTFEVQGPGWVNNELQRYVRNDPKSCQVSDGTLKITAYKSGNEVRSTRIYAHVGTGWQYGYFEARIKLPKGKGTWPAYWMMPVHVDWATEGWPLCGEIDIMEEVGVVPNEVSSSLHAKGHNHTNGTQVTAARTIPGAEDEFHIYALEWDGERIRTYVDGQQLLSYSNPHTGIDNWPYDKPYYLIFNLAWGGDWGGMRGVDESALPATLVVDYVRVFQK